MTVSSEALAAAKKYMRVEGDEDDDIIRGLYEAAALYLDNAGVERSEGNGALYDVALWSLCLHYYDHRDTVGSEAPIPTGLRPVITQLKLVAIVGGET